MLISPKKIKKSLGPDFLDPSDLGYQYLKETYGPKCQYCDSPFGSGKHDKYLSCEKCASKGITENKRKFL